VGFKADDSFLRYITLGAAGTAATAHDLRDRFGHQPIELERFAMANKKWNTKVKRLRIPDLLCVQCGRRVESKAKSKLAVTLSDSNKPGRAWHDGGLRDDDLICFIQATIVDDETVTVGQPHYFELSALHEARPAGKRSSPKAASEGSEIDITWPTIVPKRPGRVITVEGRRIRCAFDAGRTHTYSHGERWGRFESYCMPGTSFGADDTFLAGVIAAPADLTCPGGIWDIERALGSTDEATLYSAVKALRCRQDHPMLLMGLSEVVSSDHIDWRIRLEGLATLATIEPERWIDDIHSIATDDARMAEEQIEATFILAEIPNREAASALASVASEQHVGAEVRAAAAWALGQGSHVDPWLLLPLTADSDDQVARHAIAAMPTLPPHCVHELSRWLSQDRRKAATAARLFVRHHKIEPLLEAIQRWENARLWALRALGQLPPDDVRQAAGNVLDPDVEMVLDAFWIGHQDWLRQPNVDDDIAILDSQKVRYDPFTLHPRAGVAVPSVETAAVSWETRP
jgi:hypothetical protein